MKKQSKGLLAAAASILTLLASVVASGACFAWLHQPRTPKSLQK